MKQRLNWAWAAICATVMGACGASDVGDETSAEDDAPMLETIDQKIVNGTATASRPEIGRVNGCTATLITPRHVISAAHCFGYNAFQDSPGIFVIGANTYGVDFVTALDDTLGSYDVAIARLAEAVPSNVATPAVLANLQPAAGTQVTVFGYGCDDRNPEGGSGTKRYATFNWGSATQRLCPGDSGGPVVVGPHNGRGEIVAINSGYAGPRDNEAGNDIFANPTFMKERIESTIRAWESGLEVGMDRAGADYRAFNAASAAICQTTCSEEAACRAFSYTAGGRCFLKAAVPPPTPSPGGTSGLAPRRGNFDRPGTDLRVFNTADVNACESACVQDSACMSFTHDAAAGRCRLKSGAPAAAACATCTSGARRGLESGYDRPGGDYSNVAAASANACATRCANDSRCLSFTHVASTNRCFLKNAIRPPVASAGRTSGVKRGIEFNTDRLGLDLASHEIAEPLPEKCQSLCETTAGCQSWTMMLGTVAWDDRNLCFLKNGVPSTTTNAWGMYSGLRGGGLY
jgi:V8-like Glu-specific endopeptidase